MANEWPLEYTEDNPRLFLCTQSKWCILFLFQIITKMWLKTLLDIQYFFGQFTLEIESEEWPILMSLFSAVFASLLLHTDLTSAEFQIM